MGQVASADVLPALSVVRPDDQRQQSALGAADLGMRSVERFGEFARVVRRLAMRLDHVADGTERTFAAP